MSIDKRERGRYFRVLMVAAYVVLLVGMAGRDVGAQTAEFGTVARPLRFVVYGDTRSGVSMHRRLIGLILAKEPELVIHTGDLVNGGSRLSEWKTFDAITA